MGRPETDQSTYQHVARMVHPAVHPRMGDGRRRAHPQHGREHLRHRVSGAFEQPRPCPVPSHRSTRVPTGKARRLVLVPELRHVRPGPLHHCRGGSEHGGLESDRREWCRSCAQIPRGCTDSRTSGYCQPDRGRHPRRRRHRGGPGVQRRSAGGDELVEQHILGREPPQPLRDEPSGNSRRSCHSHARKDDLGQNVTRAQRSSGSGPGAHAWTPNVPARPASCPARSTIMSPACRTSSHRAGIPQLP